MLRSDEKTDQDIRLGDQEMHRIDPGCIWEMKLIVDLKRTTAKKIGLRLRAKEEMKTEIIFDLEHGELRFDRDHSDGWSRGVAHCPLNLMGKDVLDIHIYSDRSNIELFSNGYQNNISCNVFTPYEDGENSVFAEGGDAVIQQIQTWDLERVIR